MVKRRLIADGYVRPQTCTCVAKRDFAAVAEIRAGAGKFLEIAKIPCWASSPSTISAAAQLRAAVQRPHGLSSPSPRKFHLPVRQAFGKFSPRPPGRSSTRPTIPTSPSRPNLPPRGPATPARPPIRGHEFPRSHGPTKNSVNHSSINDRLIRQFGPCRSRHVRAGGARLPGIPP